MSDFDDAFAKKPKAPNLKVDPHRTISYREDSNDRVRGKETEPFDPFLGCFAIVTIGAILFAIAVAVHTIGLS